MIVSARRIPAPFTKSRTRQPALRNGLNYEKGFIRALEKAVRGTNLIVESNSWFAYRDSDNNSHCCAPDAIILMGVLPVAIIEIKYTWVATALDKIQSIYWPVVSLAIGCPIGCPTVVVKRLTEESPQPSPKLLNSTLFQWLGREAIVL
jgi:hypothetical protein